MSSSAQTLEADKQVNANPEGVRQNNQNKEEHEPQSLSCFGPFTGEKKQIGIFILLLLCTFALLNSFQVIYIFDPYGDIEAINIALITTIIPRIIFFTVIGVKSSGCRNYLSYLLIFDPITFPLCLAAYAYVIFLVNIFFLEVLDYVGLVLVCLQFLTFATCHRAIVAELQWRKWQITLYKFILSVAAGFYVIYGVRYIFPGISWTDGQDDDIDEAIKQFMILYIIGSADFVVKLYEKLCDLDQTAELKIEDNRCNRIFILNED